MTKNTNALVVVDTSKDTKGQIASGEAIDAKIKEVPGAYAKAHTLVQEIAVAIVKHAHEYGDCTRALKLVRTVPIQQARSLITYFMAVSPIGVLLSEGGKNDKVRFLKSDSKAYNAFDLEKAKTLEWWTLDAAKAEKEAVQVFAGGLFDDVLKLLKRASDNDRKGKHYTDDAVQVAAQLKTLVEAHRAKFLAGMAASNTTNDDANTGEEAGEPMGKANAA